VEPTRVSQPATYDAAAWAAIAVLCFMVAACQWVAPVPFEPRSSVGLTVACAALGGTSIFYRTVRLREEFAVMCIALMQVILFSAVGIVLSYLLARNGGALWDATLARWDRALGFDWLAYVRFVDSSRLLSAVSFVAYGSLIPQIVVLVCTLGFAKRFAALRSVMLAAILAGAISIVVSALMPATAYPSFLGVTNHDFRHVNPWAGLVHLSDLHALRDGTFAMLDFRKMQGIITFPSYHAGLSAVTLWGFWSSRPAWIKWPGMTLAALTIAATPVNGGHYLVDVLAGLGIAVASIVAARKLVLWNPDLPGLTAWPSRRSREASAR